MPSRPRSPTAGEPTTVALRHESLALPLGAVVRVLDAKAQPPRFRLSAGSCVIGSGKDAHIRVAESTVSRRHAELALVPEGVTVTDLGSRNGTFYLGQRVEKITLSPGSRITIGTVEVVIDADTESLREGPTTSLRSYRGLVGGSRAMLELLAVLKRLEGSLIHVLLEGESGVGKELVAAAIHAGSSRASRPFVAVNCGGIARELVLSELFGHRRGAFTGAVEERTGAFAVADGGTLFLDEVGELPLDVQPTLLRALESGEVRRVGDNDARTVSVRIVAATNRELDKEVEAGRFRSDLFYRLAVVKLSVPPLRERPEDIELLARTFAAGLGLPDLAPEVIEHFVRQPWPGNVRELKNAVEAYVALGTLPGAAALREIPMLDHVLRQLIDTDQPYADQKERVLDQFTQTYLRMLLTRTGGNQSEAARVSGLERSYLGKLLAKHGIGKT